MFNSINAAQRNQGNSMDYDALMVCGGVQNSDYKISGRCESYDCAKRPSKKKRRHSSFDLAAEHNRAKIKREKKFHKDSGGHSSSRKAKKERKSYNDKIRQRLADVRLTLVQIQTDKATLEEELRNVVNTNSAEATSLQYYYTTICVIEKEYQLLEMRLKNPRKVNRSYKAATKYEDYAINRFYDNVSDTTESHTDYPEHEYWLKYQAIQKAYDFWNSLPENQKANFQHVFDNLSMSEAGFVLDALLPIVAG